MVQGKGQEGLWSCRILCISRPSVSRPFFNPCYSRRSWPRRIFPLLFRFVPRIMQAISFALGGTNQRRGARSPEGGSCVVTNDSLDGRPTSRFRDIVRQRLRVADDKVRNWKSEKQDDCRLCNTERWHSVQVHVCV